MMHDARCTMHDARCTMHDASLLDGWIDDGQSTIAWECLSALQAAVWLLEQHADPSAAWTKMKLEANSYFCNGVDHYFLGCFG